MRNFVSLIVAIISITLTTRVQASNLYYDFGGLRYSVSASNNKGSDGMYASASAALSYGTIEHTSVSLQSRWMYDPATGNSYQDPTRGQLYFSMEGIMKKPWGETPYIGESLTINSPSQGVNVYMSTGGNIYSDYYGGGGKGAAPAGDENSLIPAAAPVPTTYWSSGNGYFQSSNFELDGYSMAQYSEWLDNWSGLYRFNLNFQVPVHTLDGYALGSEPMGITAITAVPEPGAMALFAFAPLALLVRRPARRLALCNS